MPTPAPTERHSPDQAWDESTRKVVDLLTDALLSHLSHEQRELVEPRARLSPP